MIQLKKIENLHSIERTNKKIELKYLGFEEPNRGQVLFYYALLIDGIDKTEALFSTKTLQCVVDEKIETEHPDKDFAFIPCLDSVLLDTLANTKTNLRVYFRENGNTTRDGLVGSFFYSEQHLLINSRSLILTNLLTLENKKIKFENDVHIEWAFLINANQILVIQAYSNKCFIYDLEKQEIIEKRNIVDESSYPNIFRWIYRGQEYNSNKIQIELIQREENQHLSTYFEIQ